MPTHETPPTFSSKTQDEVNNFNPSFEFSSNGIGIEDIKDEVEGILDKFAAIPHNQLLSQLLEQIEEVNFKSIVYPAAETLLREVKSLEKLYANAGGRITQDEASEEIRLKLKAQTDSLDKMKLLQRHYFIIAIEEIIRLAQAKDWGLCRKHDFIYLYNGAFWKQVDNDTFQTFLGDAAQKMGIEKYNAKYHKFKLELYKQFLSDANLPSPERPKDSVFINLKNGTFEITPHKQGLREYRRADFITYQLPFKYDPEAKAPLFESYLNKVQPDKDRQKVLAEYLGYVFIHPTTLKLEKTLLLYGTGANGKSVFFEIVNALLGTENVCSYSLQNLTKYDSYQRAELANKLVNYASEINGKLETSIFKQLVSGEPVEARQIYGTPFTMTHYAKLIFNCNELPKDVEQTNAFFRRFLIVPFDVTIAEAEQDKQLSKKIIERELSGIFNWLLEGLTRLLNQKSFTDCEAVRRQLEQYRMHSDSVQMFLEDENYKPSTKEMIPQKQLFAEYRDYCDESNYKSCSTKTFGERIRAAGYVTERKTQGNMVYGEKKIF